MGLLEFPGNAWEHDHPWPTLTRKGLVEGADHLRLSCEHSPSIRSRQSSVWKRHSASHCSSQLTTKNVPEYQLLFYPTSGPSWLAGQHWSEAVLAYGLDCSSLNLGQFHYLFYVWSMISALWVLSPHLWNHRPNGVRGGLSEAVFTIVLLRTPGTNAPLSTADALQCQIYKYFSCWKLVRPETKILSEVERPQGMVSIPARGPQKPVRDEKCW